MGVPQVGGSGSESTSDFSRLGGKELSVVDELGSNLSMSHEGDDSHMAVKPLNVILPNAASESEFPNWVIKCAKWIHSKVGVTYVV